MQGNIITVHLLGYYIVNMDFSQNCDNKYTKRTEKRSVEAESTEGLAAHCHKGTQDDLIND